MRILTVVAGLLVASGAVAAVTAAPLSRGAALQVMHERHEGMARIGKATRAAGRALGSSAVDVATVRTSAATISQLASRSQAWFPPGTGPNVAKTGAKPEIWAKPADFAARNRAFLQAAQAFELAAKTGDANAMRGRFAELGKTCKSCHDSYRTEMHH